jgi:rhamnosyltransferase
MPFFMSTRPIFIALATYEGAAYLRPLIESIRRQSLADWTLLVRDDGSSDATPEILRQVAAEDRRIVLCEDGLGRLGVAGNFGALMQEAFERGAEYLAFADQDDVWQPDKLEKQLQRMKHEETAAGRRLAHLVYSDLAVVDEQMRPVHPSLLGYSRLGPVEGRPLRALLGRSCVLGCACTINRPLLEFALPLPPTVAGHDWWVALCAAALGKISYVAEPTLWYRRHGKNSSGPASFWGGFNPLRYSWRRRWQAGVGIFRRSIDQALSLRQRLPQQEGNAAQDTRAVLDQFCEIFERPASGLQRIHALRRLGVPAIDLPRRLLYYLCVLTLPRNLTTLPRAERGTGPCFRTESRRK